MIHLTVKTQGITCKLKDNLKEKFYNFSLKMITKEQEFSSDHSLNYKNMMVAPTFPEKINEENRDENYQMIMDENKILQTSYFVSDVNKNYTKLRTDHLDDNMDDSELIEDLPPPTLQSRSSLLAVSRTLNNQKINTSTLARNKDVIWDFNENINLGVTLEVRTITP